MVTTRARQIWNRIASRRHTRRWAGDAATRAFLRHQPDAGVHRLSAKLAGRRVPFWVRGGTLDILIAQEVLCDDSEYRVPRPINPRVILDVGANIGMTALYYLTLYPEAHVYCFEPLPENLALLRKNLEPHAERVTIIPKGLGDAEGTFTYERSDDPRNFGGGGFHGRGDGDCSQRLPVTTLRQVAEEHGIEHADLIKLDAEGAEWATIQGAPPELIASAEVLIGELHGRDDLRLLQQLEKTHHLGFEKSVDREGFHFEAVVKETTQANSGTGQVLKPLRIDRTNTARCA